MTGIQPVVRVGLAAFSFALVSPLWAPAYAATFNFVLSPPPPPRSSVNLDQIIFSSISDPDLRLTIADSNSTGSRNNSTVNVNNLHGLCAWTAVGTTGYGRCGYGPDPIGSVSGFSLFFDQDVVIRSVNISHFDPLQLSAGRLRFYDGLNKDFEVLISSEGLYSLAYHASAYELVHLSTSATFAAGNHFSTGLIRLSSMDVEPVPGPLSMMSPAVLFYFNRRISARLRAARFSPIASRRLRP
jgi:hypothetical protein